MSASETLNDNVKTRTPFEEHLCQVLELAPVSVTRITLDGTFLAVNEAALSMFGGERLGQLLGTSLLHLIAQEQREGCREFLDRLVAGERRSAEFDLTGLDGVCRAVLLHAAPIPDPHDGIESAVCAWHFVGEQRRLEQALLDAAARADQQAAEDAEETQRLHAALEQEQRKASAALAERQQRIADLEKQVAGTTRVEAAAFRADQQAAVHAEEVQRLRVALEQEQRQASVALAERQQRIADLERQVSEVAAREEAAAARADQQAAAHAEETQRLQAALEQEQRKATGSLAERQQRVAELEGQLAEVATRVEAAALHADQQAAAHAEEMGRLRAALESEQRKAGAALAEREHRIAELEKQLAAVAAQELAAAAVMAEHRQQVCALQSEIGRLEGALKDAAADAGQQIAALEMNRADLERAMHAIEDERHREGSAHAQKVAELEAGIAELRGELDRRTAEHTEEIARLDALLARSAAELQSLAHQAEQARVDRQALEMRLRRDERLAQAGRLAISIAGDLEDRFQTVSNRVRTLVESTDPGDQRHAALTDVACAAIDGAALAHQISATASKEAQE